MFFFESMPWYSVVMWFVVVGGLMLMNELRRATDINTEPLGSILYYLKNNARTSSSYCSSNMLNSL